MWILEIGNRGSRRVELLTTVRRHCWCWEKAVNRNLPSPGSYHSTTSATLLLGIRQNKTSWWSTDSSLKNTMLPGSRTITQPATGPLPVHVTCLVFPMSPIPHPCRVHSPSPLPAPAARVLGVGCERALDSTLDQCCLCKERRSVLYGMTALLLCPPHPTCGLSREHSAGSSP